MITVPLFLIWFLAHRYRTGFGTLEPTSIGRTLRVLDQIDDLAEHFPLPREGAGDRNRP
jgi:hypothetical protein